MFGCSPRTVPYIFLIFFNSESKVWIPTVEIYSRLQEYLQATIPVLLQFVRTLVRMRRRLETTSAVIEEHAQKRIRSPKSPEQRHFTAFLGEWTSWCMATKLMAICDWCVHWSCSYYRGNLLASNILLTNNPESWLTKMMKLIVTKL